MSPRRIERMSEESKLQRYGIIFRAWDFVRINKPTPVPPRHRTYDVVSVRCFRVKPGMSILTDCYGFVSIGCIYCAEPSTVV